MPKSTRIFVLGSCVTRDAFELDTTGELTLVGIWRRSSVGSSFRRKADRGGDTSTIASAFQRRIVEWDLTKSLEETLRSSDFDLMVYDPIDERFALADFGADGIATVSNEFLSASSSVPYTTVKSGTEEFTRLWTTGWYRLLAVLDALGMRSQLRVNRVFWAEECEGSASFGDSYSNNGIAYANNFLGELYSIMEQDLEPSQFIRYPAGLFIGDARHKWGPSPFHYTKAFYLHFLSQIASDAPPPPAVRHIEDAVWEHMGATAAERVRGPNSAVVDAPVRHYVHTYLKRHLVYGVHERPLSRRIVFVFPGLDSTPGFTRMSYEHFGAELDATVVHLKDHFGAHGCYLLSVAGDSQIRNVVLSLVRELIARYSVPPEGVYFVGTSKGGTSALAYGLMHGSGRVIAGEPQVALGNFLYHSADQLEWQRSIAYAIFGRVDPRDRENADGLLPAIFNQYGARFRGSVSVLEGAGTGYEPTHVEPLVGLALEQGLSRRIEVRRGLSSRPEGVAAHFIDRLDADHRR